MDGILLKIKQFYAKFISYIDPEDMEDIFSRVKIPRTPSTKAFEIIVGVMVVCICFLSIRNFILDISEYRFDYLAIGAVGIVAPLLTLWRSYHPSNFDLPMKIVNARQVHYVSLCGRCASVGVALFFLWVNSNVFIESETLFFDGMVVCAALLFLNCAYFMYKIYKVRKLVEVEPEPAVKHETLLCIGVLVAVFLLDFLLHVLLKDMPGGIFKGILIGVITVFVICGAIWVCQRYFGLFKEITPEKK